MTRTLLFALAVALAPPLPAAAQDVVVATRTEADGSRTLVHQVSVPAPPAQVWTAVSTAEGWTTWAVPVAWAPAPDLIETSYTPAARPGDSTTIRQRILAAIPGRLLVFATIKAPAGFPDFDTYAKVTGFFELEPEGSGTRVRLTQTGYAATEAGTRLLGFFEAGNRQTLEQLRDRFAKGPVDWSKK